MVTQFYKVQEKGREGIQTCMHLYSVDLRHMHLTSSCLNFKVSINT